MHRWHPLASSTEILSLPSKPMMSISPTLASGGLSAPHFIESPLIKRFPAASRLLTIL
jgi:hypothetical protein